MGSAKLTRSNFSRINEDKLYALYEALAGKLLNRCQGMASGHKFRFAVMTQIWIAMCVYLFLAFIKFQSKMSKNMQQILRLLQLNLFEKRDLMALLPGDPPILNHVYDSQMSLL